jgi:hypothetical protein
MNQAVVIDLVAREARPPGPLRRMRLVSRGLEVLFLALAVGFSLVGAAVVFDFVVPYAPDLIAACPSGGLLVIGPHVWPAHCVGVGAMPTVQRLAHAACGPLLLVPMVLLFWSLRGLFANYAKGVVFAPDNARSLKHVGAALIFLGVVPLLNHAFLASLHVAIERTWIQESNIQELILGAVVYVIAQVMQLGRELEEERSQFV